MSRPPTAGALHDWLAVWLCLVPEFAEASLPAMQQRASSMHALAVGAACNLLRPLLQLQPPVLAARATDLLRMLLDCFLTGQPLPPSLVSRIKTQSTAASRLPCLSQRTTAAALFAAQVHAFYGTELEPMCLIDHTLLAASAELAQSPEALQPCLQDDVGAVAGVLLPPAALPRPLAQLRPLSPPLRSLFVSDGGGCSPQLQQLLSIALQELPTATSLCAGGDPTCPLPLVVSGAVDFGTVPVTALSPDDVAATAAALAAAAAPASNGSAARGSSNRVAGTLLDVLHLLADASLPGQGSTEQPRSGTPQSALRFREVLLSHEGPAGSEDVLVLGGVAAPHFPHTFAALDSASLFWEGAYTRVGAACAPWLYGCCPRLLQASGWSACALASSTP